MADYLVQEDGVSRLTLEDGSGFILLEEQGAAPAVTRGMKTKMWHRTRMWILFLVGLWHV